MKASYQVDLTLTGRGPQQIHGIDLASSNVPAKVAYDLALHAIYWHDNEFTGRNSIKTMSLADDKHSEHSLITLAHGTPSGSCSSCNQVVVLVLVVVIVVVCCTGTTSIDYFYCNRYDNEF